MKRTAMLIVATMLAATTATADGLSEPWARTPILEPECRHFGIIPCHTVFNYEEPEGGTPDRPRTVREEKPKPPNVKPPKDRPCKLGGKRKRC